MSTLDIEGLKKIMEDTTMIPLRSILETLAFFIYTGASEDVSSDEFSYEAIRNASTGFIRDVWETFQSNRTLTRKEAAEAEGRLYAFLRNLSPLQLVFIVGMHMGSIEKQEGNSPSKHEADVMLALLKQACDIHAINHPKRYATNEERKSSVENSRRAFLALAVSREGRLSICCSAQTAADLLINGFVEQHVNVDQSDAAQLAINLANEYFFTCFDEKSNPEVIDKFFVGGVIEMPFMPRVQMRDDQRNYVQDFLNTLDFENQED